MLNELGANSVAVPAKNCQVMAEVWLDTADIQAHIKALGSDSSSGVLPLHLPELEHHHLGLLELWHSSSTPGLEYYDGELDL